MILVLQIGIYQIVILSDSEESHRLHAIIDPSLTLRMTNQFRFIEAKLRIFGDMLSYLSRLVPEEHLEDYSFLCSRRSDARLLLLTPGAVLQQCSAAPFSVCILSDFRSP